MKSFTKLVVINAVILFAVAVLFRLDIQAQTSLVGTVWHDKTPLILYTYTFMKDGKVKSEADDEFDVDVENGTFKLTGTTLEMNFPSRTIKATIKNNTMEGKVHFKDAKKPEESFKAEKSQI